MKVKDYNRNKAVDYASKWALSRNPMYYNFNDIGGDCTNFVSQCIFSGANLMNYTNVTGWYYNNINDRTSSWTSVEHLYNFLISNDGLGPFARLVDKSQIEIGDVIELGRNSGAFYHSLFVSDIFNDKIYVSSHTYDAYNKLLDKYIFERIRSIHILGVRTT
jgi:hypothetical protein